MVFGTIQCHSAYRSKEKAESHYEIRPCVLIVFYHYICLFANTARRQRTHQRTHDGQGFLAAWEALAHQVIRRICQIILLQSDILTKTIEERQLKVGGLPQSAMRADLDTIATEDTAIEGKRIAGEVALSHHERASGTDLDTGPTGDTIGIMQAHIEGGGDDGIEAFAEHAIAIRPDHIVTNAHTLRTVNALVGIAQDEAVREIHLMIVIIAGLSIMETIIGQPMLDAILLQITLPGCRTGTLQTTSRLSLSLLLQIAHLDDAEVAFAFLIGQHRHLDFGFHRLVGHDIEQVRLALLQLQPPGDLLHFLSHQERVNRACSQFALRHTFDNRFGSHLAVSTGEDPVAIRHKVMRIGLDRLPFCPLHSRLLI